MSERIQQPAHAHQVFRLQPANAHGARVEPAAVGLEQYRQKQGVEPGQGARQKAQEDAVAVGAAPVEAGHQCRHELGAGGEGEKPHVGESFGEARGLLQGPAKQQEAQDGRLPDLAQDTAEVIAWPVEAVTDTQVHRHEEFVRDHQRQGNGGHQHHGGSGGHGADKGHGGEPGVTGDRREGEDVAVAGNSHTGQVKAAGFHQGQHHDREQGQVEREHPAGATGRGFVMVFHHQHMELARQTHDGEGTDQQLRVEPGIPEGAE